ncbi:MAG: 30S ribosomal protein S8 [Rickettsiales bacterium]
MSFSDPISDLICRINNAQSAKLRYADVPYSKIKKSILDVLSQEGYVSAIEEITQSTSHKLIRVFLRYDRGKPVIKEFKRVSTPGRRFYSGISNLKKYYGGLGVFILSTSKGVLADHVAKSQNVGGEIICSLF